MLSVDEMSQIQALDKTQPGLPLKSRPSGKERLYVAAENVKLFLRRFLEASTQVGHKADRAVFRQPRSVD